MTVRAKKGESIRWEDRREGVKCFPFSPSTGKICFLATLTPVEKGGEGREGGEEWRGRGNREGRWIGRRLRRGEV